MLILIFMTEIYEICCKSGRRYSIAAPESETMATQLNDWIFSNLLLETNGCNLERSIYSKAKTG